MCHGHPRFHPCAHTSIIWYYCPSAVINLDTGYETPCSKISFASGQPTSSDCPLQNCYFKEKGGSWTCCSCKQGPNTQGWCTMPLDGGRGSVDSSDTETMETTCDHGCCYNCTEWGSNGSSRSSSPDVSFTKLGKGSGSKRSTFGSSASASASASHRRSNAVSSVAHGIGQADGSTAKLSSKNSSSKTKHKSKGGEADCRPKKHKSSAKGSAAKAR